MEPFDDNLSHCIVHITNNTNKVIDVGVEAIRKPTAWNSLNEPELYDNPIGQVYRHDSAKLQLWGFGPYEDGNFTWQEFFRESGIDSFQIVLADDINVLFEWFNHHNDSLLLKKYTFTLSDLQNERNTVSIIYP